MGNFERVAREAQPSVSDASEIIPIRQVRVGDRGKLVLTGCASSAVQRLMAMGLVPGTPVAVLRVAPLGDPVVLATRSFRVSLRRHEAEGLALER